MQNTLFKQLSLKHTLCAVATMLGSISPNVEAALTSYTINKVDLVHSSESDVTWTKDANLLGTMLASDAALISKVVAASTNNYDSRSYIVTAADFESSTDRATWYGANAFVSYLNSVNYAGSNSWQLPTLANFNFSFNTPSNGVSPGNELTELFYQELGGLMFGTIPDTPTFDNEAGLDYWYSTESPFRDTDAYAFDMGFGNNIAPLKNSLNFLWLITPGTVSASVNPAAVPVPAAAWLFGSGLVGVAALRRRKQTT